MKQHVGSNYLSDGKRKSSLRLDNDLHVEELPSVPRRLGQVIAREGKATLVIRGDDGQFVKGVGREFDYYSIGSRVSFELVESGLLKIARHISQVYA